MSSYSSGRKVPLRMASAPSPVPYFSEKIASGSLVDRVHWAALTVVHLRSRRETYMASESPSLRQLERYFGLCALGLEVLGT